MRVALVSLALALGSTLSSVAAAQDGPPLQLTAPEIGRRPRASVALLAGYGLPVDTFAGDMSPYRFGLGVRAGATFPVGAYVGGTFVKHLGTRRLGAREGGGTTYVAIAHDTLVGPEIGWDISLSRRILLRPFVGGGLLLTLGKTAVGSASISDDHAWFYLAPGLLAAHRFGELFVGVDLRMTIVPAQSVKQWAPAGMLALGIELGAGR